MKNIKWNWITGVIILLLGIPLVATSQAVVHYKDQNRELTVELNKEKQKLKLEKENSNDLLKENRSLASEKEKLKQQENTVEKEAANTAKENEMLERQVSE